MTNLRTIVMASVASLLCCTTFTLANARPDSNMGLPIEAVPTFSIPELNWSEVFAEDAERATHDVAPRFAIPHKASITPATHGIWERLDGRTLRWSLRVGSPNAVSLNLGFERWELPISASMVVSATDRSMAVRPFTTDDNNEHGQLWTPVVQGDELLIEIIVAAREQDEINKNIELTSINVGYRGFYDRSVGRSGSCNVDVVCAEGDLWWDEIPCVAVTATGNSTVTVLVIPIGNKRCCISGIHAAVICCHKVWSAVL